RDVAMYPTKPVNHVSHRWPRGARMDSSAVSGRSRMTRSTRCVCTSVRWDAFYFSIRSMQRVTFFAAACAALLLSTPSFAQTDAKTAMERGSEAMRSGSYREAVQRYQMADGLADEPAIAAEARYWTACALH